MMISSKQSETDSKTSHYGDGIRFSVLELGNGNISNAHDFLISCATLDNNKEWSQQRQREELRHDVTTYALRLENLRKQTLSEFKQELIRQNTGSINFRLNTIDHLKKQMDLTQSIASEIEQWKLTDPEQIKFREDVLISLNDEFLQYAFEMNNNAGTIKICQQEIENCQNDEFVEQKYKEQLKLFESRLQQAKDQLSELLSDFLELQSSNMDLINQIEADFESVEQENTLEKE